MHPVINQVTENIQNRSAARRAAYLNQIDKARTKGPQRSILHCGNLAHGFAACAKQDKAILRGNAKANIAIVSAYNDMLSAHQPYAVFPDLIKEAISAAGGVAQFAGGVPAMCDGITQGQPGMELSLLSRDVIALSTAVALSHNMFDGGLLLGICDKIVPGLLMAALAFGHLPLFCTRGAHAFWYLQSGKSKNSSIVRSRSSRQKCLIGCGSSLLSYGWNMHILWYGQFKSISY